MSKPKLLLEVAYQCSDESAVRARAFSLVSPGLRTRGGPFLALLAKATRRSITGQIATKMTWEAVLSRCSELVSSDDSPATPADLVREGLRHANAEVYASGHRMSAGGAMGALAMLIACDGARICIGRTGEFSAYLFRQGALVSMFAKDEDERAAGLLERFIGANSQVLVDLASTALEADDRFIFSSFALDTLDQQWCCAELSQRLSLAAQSAAIRSRAELAGRNDPVFLLLRATRATIVLKDVAEVGVT